MISCHDYVYLSGPMTGLPDCNRPAFFDAEAYLQQVIGCCVFNPARTPEMPNWEGYMRFDLPYMAKATMLVQLDGWERSRGARIEHELALMAGVPVLPLDEIKQASGVAILKLRNHFHDWRN